MSWIQRKKDILNWIISIVDTAQTHNLKVVKDKIIAEVGFRYGSSRKKSLEYIKILTDSGRLIESWDHQITYLSRPVIEVDI